MSREVKLGDVILYRFPKGDAVYYIRIKRIDNNKLYCEDLSTGDSEAGFIYKNEVYYNFTAELEEILND